MAYICLLFLAALKCASTVRVPRASRWTGAYASVRDDTGEGSEKPCVENRTEAVMVCSHSECCLSIAVLIATCMEGGARSRSSGLVEQQIRSAHHLSPLHNAPRTKQIAIDHHRWNWASGVQLDGRHYGASSDRENVHPLATNEAHLRQADAFKPRVECREERQSLSL